MFEVVVVERSRSKVAATLGVCMVVGLVAGSFLGFGVYSAQIRKNGRFTATESHTLGIIMDLGAFLTGPVVGEVHDRIGPRLSCMVAAVMNALGYSIVAIGVSNAAGSTTNSIPFLSTGFLLVGAASPLAYVAAMYTATSLMSVRHRPLAVAAVGVPNGLSAVVVSLTFHYGNTGFATFFVIWAVISFTALTAAAVLLPRVVEAVGDEQPTGPDPDGASKHSTNNAGGEAGDDASDDTPLLLSARIETGDAAMYRPSECMQRTVPAWVHHLAEVVQLPLFWRMCCPAALVIGVSLMCANAASGIAEACTPDGNYKAMAFELVVTWAGAGVAVRGAVLQFMYKYDHSFGIYITACCIAAAVSQFLLAGWPTDRSVVFVGFVLIGGAQGAMWPITVIILRNTIPARRFGMAMGAFSAIPGITGLIFSYICAGIYDHKSNSPNDLCVGDTCYRESFGIGAAACVVAVIASVPLIAKTQKPREVGG